MDLRNHPENGFTLLEIIIGLVISSLIMVGLSLALKTINMGFDSTTVLVERQSNISAGLAIVAGDIARIQRVVDNPEKPSRFLFSGNADSATYIMEERPGNNAAGLYWVRLETRSSGVFNELVRMRSPYVMGQNGIPALAWKDEVTILRGDFSIAFSYRSPMADLWNWSDSWQNQSFLPGEVRIELIDLRTGRLRVPGFVQPLKINAEADCVVLTQPGCTINTNGLLATGGSSQ